MRRSAFILASLIACVTPLQSQGPTVTASQSALGRCTYETCALRIDRSLFGRKVAVGLDAFSSPMGVIGGGLVNAVDRVPLAREEAQKGRRNMIKAAVLGAIGSFAILYSVQGTRGIDPLEWSNGRVFGSLIVGSAATITGAMQAVYAERHFSRAVWLYNREIPR